jgi:hypothetical protein
MRGFFLAPRYTSANSRTVALLLRDSRDILAFPQFEAGFIL